MLDKAPIRRILNTILSYAVADGVRQIRLESKPPSKGLPILFRRPDGEFEQQMAAPKYVQRPLFDEIKSRCVDGKFLFSFVSSELEIELRFEVQAVVEDEVAALNLEIVFRGNPNDDADGELHF